MATGTETAGGAAPLADPSAFAALLDGLFTKRWVVHAKPPFGGAEQVFRYLGRYTHRIGLSNHRLLAIDERGIRLRTRGYALDPPCAGGSGGLRGRAPSWALWGWTTSGEC